MWNEEDSDDFGTEEQDIPDEIEGTLGELFELLQDKVCVYEPHCFRCG